MLTNIMTMPSAGGSYTLRPDIVGADMASRPDAAGLADGVIYVATDVSHASVVVGGVWSEWFALKGPEGPQGPSASVVVDSVETLDPGSDAIVENVGTSTEARFRFSIPRGADGTGGAASETTAALVSTIDGWSWNGGASTFDAASLSSGLVDANLAPTRDTYTGSALVADVTLLGIPAVRDNKSGANWNLTTLETRSLADGELFQLLVLFEFGAGDPGSPQMRIGPSGAVSSVVFDTTAETFTVAGDWSTDLGGVLSEPTGTLTMVGGVGVAVLDFESLADTADVAFGFNSDSADGTATEWKVALARRVDGNPAFDPFTDDFAEAGAVASATLTLTGAGPWAVTVSTAGTVLTPPPLPTGTGERVVRELTVEITGSGTLALDAAAAAWAYDAPAGDALGAGTHDLAMLGREADTLWRVDWSTYQ